jgi:hypothetical protein
MAGVTDQLVKLPVLVWHVSHWPLLGMCVTGLESSPVKAYELLWQDEHSPVVPVWFMVAGLKATKFL